MVRRCWRPRSQGGVLEGGREGGSGVGEGGGLRLGGVHAQAAWKLCAVLLLVAAASAQAQARGPVVPWELRSPLACLMCLCFYYLSILTCLGR